MRYFAKIDENNLVEQVIVADSAEWCENNIGGVWIEAFKKGAQRFNFPGTGFTYDRERDAFIPPADFPSWILNEDTCLWEAPTPRPDEGEWEWDESAVAWVEVVEPSA